MQGSIRKFALGIAALAACSAVPAQATLYYEAYEGHQHMCEAGNCDSSLDFSFDMWFDNDFDDYGTNASYLGLTDDAAGAYDGEWFRAWMVVGINSSDTDTESLSLTITALDGSGDDGATWELGSYDVTPNPNDPWSSYTLYYDFDAAQTAAFEEWGWGRFTVSITPNGSNGLNDLQLNRVALYVNVPEPAVLLLLASGLLLLGFGATARRMTANPA